MTTLTAGLSPLLRLALRRDRIMLPVWLYALIATVAGTAFSIRKLYPDQASRDRLAASINGNPRCAPSTGRSTTRTRSARSSPGGRCPTAD
ncbi:hypothetical protein ACFQZC_36900 [Streptacidiphilus monticola]